MIFVHVQKMYKTCTEDVQYIYNILIGVPDYSSIFLFCFFKSREDVKYTQKINTSSGLQQCFLFLFFQKMKRKLSPPHLRPSSKLGVPDYSSRESARNFLRGPARALSESAFQ